MSELKVVNQGRGGFIDIDGYEYPIGLFSDGSFCVFFPNKNRHSRLQEHLDRLKEFAASQNPEWFVENRSRNYR